METVLPRTPFGLELTLAAITTRKPQLKKRVAPEVEEAVVAIAIDQPGWGQTRASHALKKRGIAVWLCREAYVACLARATSPSAGSPVSASTASPDGRTGATPRLTRPAAPRQR